MKIKERLRRIEKSIIHLTEVMSITAKATRAECPDCKSVWYLGDLKITEQGRYYSCKGCGKTVKVTIAMEE